MAAIHPIHPPHGSEAPAVDSARQRFLAASGNTFNNIVNGLNGIAGNLAWWLQELDAFLAAVQEFGNDANTFYQQMNGMLTTPPSGDIKQLLAALKDLSQLPGKFQAQLTQMFEAKFGKPLPKQYQSVIKAEVQTVQTWVNSLIKSVGGLDSSCPGVDVIKQQLENALEGKPVDQAALAAAFAQAASNMPNQQSPNLTPTWSTFNTLSDSIQSTIQSAQFVDQTITAQADEKQQEISAAYSGSAKAIDKQFKTLMQMIRQVMSGG